MGSGLRVPETRAGLGSQMPFCALGGTQRIWLNLLTIIEALCGPVCAWGLCGPGLSIAL